VAARAGSWSRIRLWSSVSARLDPELLDERPPRLPKGRERVRLPPSAVEGVHELGAEVLAERMLRDQRLELGDQLAGSPEGEVGLEAALQRRETKLVQARGFGRESVLMEDVLERLAAPEAEGLPEQLGRSGGIVVERRSRGAREALEPVRIEPVGLDPKHVAVRMRRQDRACISRPAGLEDPAELRDVEPELAAGLWRIVGPEHVDDPVRRDHRVRVHQEQREQRPLRRRADPHDRVVEDDLDRPQHPEFQRPPHGSRRIESTTRCAQSGATSAQRPGRQSRRHQWKPVREG
jgi:hypothetical protein